MSRPLIASKEAKVAASRWHAAVFALYGPYCFFHRLRDPHSKVRASDAMHVIARSQLGTALAYVSPELGRPGCRDCHVVQELGLDPAYAFPLAVRVQAVRAHNAVAKQKIIEPTE